MTYFDTILIKNFACNFSYHSCVLFLSLVFVLQWAHLITCPQREYMKMDTTSNLTSGLLAVYCMRWVTLIQYLF